MSSWFRGKKAKKPTEKLEAKKAANDAAKPKQQTNWQSQSVSDNLSEKVRGYCRHLEQNDPTLTELSLGRNSIGVEGATAIARALEKNSKLTLLYLELNSIGVEGAKAIARALENNSTLTTLSLGYNSIGDEGATAIARALEKNSTLTKLKV